MNNHIEIKNKRQCCSCAACISICPKKAIKMKKDEYGFEYPVVNKDKCINCGLCKKSCAYINNNENKNIEKKVYAAVNQNDEQLNISSSGGVFSAISTSFIKQGGVVYGCSMEVIDEKLTPIHIRIDELSSLIKLQGSKYVQSNMETIYRNIQLDLKEGKKVLFSGVPCQVAAVKNYLKTINISAEKLFTIDIICHGTPSSNFFQNYITVLEKS